MKKSPLFVITIAAIAFTAQAQGVVDENNALNFEGVDDYVDFENPPSLQIGRSAVFRSLPLH
jgi:hypothetical protein